MSIFAAFPDLLDECTTEELEEEESSRMESEHSTESVRCEHEETMVTDTGHFCIDCGIATDVAESNTEYIPDNGTGFVLTGSMNKSSGIQRRREVSVPAGCERNALINELYSVGIDDNLHDGITALFTEISNGVVFKGKSRKSVLFACVYTFLRIHNIGTLSVNELAIMFGLDNRTAVRGLKRLCLSGYGYILKNNVSAFIVEQCKRLHASTSLAKDIIAFYNQFVINKSSLINRSRPSSISAGVIYYYLLIFRETPPTLGSIARTLELSDLTVKKIAREIARLVASRVLGPETSGLIT